MNGQKNFFFVSLERILDVKCESLLLGLNHQITLDIGMYDWLSSSASFPVRSD